MANLIDQLPEVNEDKPENKTAVDAVLKQYEALTEDHPADKTVTSAVVPNQVKKGKFLFKVIKVSNHAFDSFKNLEWIVIHRNVRVIGEDAFKGTASLTKINVKGSGIVSGKVAGAFEGAGKNGRLTVKVPKNKVNEYRELFTGEGGLDGSVKAA